MDSKIYPVSWQCRLIATFLLGLLWLLPKAFAQIGYEGGGGEGGGTDILACPCAANQTTIIASENGTLYSTLGLPAVLDNSVHKGCIAISGKLIIDIDVTIKDCPSIQMQECSEIVVQGKKQQQPARHLTMEGNTIVGCDKMWKGILIEPYAWLTFRGNTISDAEYANNFMASDLTSSAIPTRAEIQYNVYNRNHIGVYASSPNPSMSATGWNVWQVENVGGFIGNTIMSTGPDNPLLPPCSNLGNYNSLYGYAGMVVRGFANFAIGVEQQASNHFINLRNGVIGEYIGLTVQNAHFSNMIGYMGNKVPAFEESRGVGVVGYNCWQALVDGCRFSKVGHAVFASGDFPTWVLKNVISMARRGIAIYDPWAFTISNNDIGFLDYGIEIKEIDSTPSTNSSYRIENNTLRTEGAKMSGDGFWAIHSQNALGNPLADPHNTITRNKIFISDIGTGGISIENQDMWELKENKITFSPRTDQALIDGTGIFIWNSSFNFLYGNEVRDVTNGTSPGASAAIEVFNGKYNSFCCNVTDGNSLGVTFGGACDGTIYRTFEHSNHEVSLLLHPGAVIGPQTGSAGTSNSNRFNANSGYAICMGDASQSIFRVASANPPSSPPLVFPSTGWFQVDDVGETDCGSDLECEPPQFTSGGGSETNRKGHGTGQLAKPIQEEPTDGADRIKETIALAFFPNPTTGHLYWSGTNEAVRVKVFNLTGQLAAETVTSDSRIDLNHLANGVYMVQLFTESRALLSTQKVVLQR